jgi:hypothetical protein
MSDLEGQALFIILHAELGRKPHTKLLPAILRAGRMYSEVSSEYIHPSGL